MVNVEDFAFVGSKQNTRRYRLSCDQCGTDRGYGMKSRSHMLCKKCTHAGKCYFDHNKPEFKQRMSKAKKGRATWNKGTSKYSKEQRQLRCNMSSAVRIRLNSRDSSKKGESYLKVLNYSIEELSKHLEQSFHSNPETGEMMTWDNYGQHGWHIDHKIPDSWFYYKSMNDDGFKGSWALSNLQPKWAKENHIKGNHYAD